MYSCDADLIITLKDLSLRNSVDAEFRVKISDYLFSVWFDSDQSYFNSGTTTRVKVNFFTVEEENIEEFSEMMGEEKRFALVDGKQILGYIKLD